MVRARIRGRGDDRRLAEDDRQDVVSMAAVIHDDATAGDSGLVVPAVRQRNPGAESHFVENWPSNRPGVDLPAGVEKILHESELRRDRENQPLFLGQFYHGPGVFHRHRKRLLAQDVHPVLEQSLGQAAMKDRWRAHTRGVYVTASRSMSSTLVVDAAAAIGRPPFAGPAGSGSTTAIRSAVSTRVNGAGMSIGNMPYPTIAKRTVMVRPAFLSGGHQGPAVLGSFER